MSTLLYAREVVILFYKRFEQPFNYVFKLIVGLLLFSFLSKIGAYMPYLAPLFEGGLRIPVYLLCAFAFAVLSPTLSNGVVALYLVAQVSSNIVVAGLLLLVFALILFLYARLDPKNSYLILAMVIGFYFRVPYAVVLFAGLYMGLRSIIPVTIGTFLWNFIPLFQNMRATVAEPDTSDLLKIPELLLDTYESFQTGITADFTWVYLAFVFAMAITGVFLITRLSINYAKEIAILVGGITSVFGCVVGASIVEVPGGIGGVILFNLISIALVEAMSFMDLALDYHRAERVQFEDEDYYYYVKAIPKLGSPSPVSIQSEGKKRERGMGEVIGESLRREKTEVASEPKATSRTGKSKILLKKPEVKPEPMPIPKTEPAPRSVVDDRLGVKPLDDDDFTFLDDTEEDIPVFTPKKKK